MGTLIQLNVCGPVFRDRCTINQATALLSGCGLLGSGWVTNYALAVQDTYLYVANYSPPKLTRCDINSTNGDISACAETGSGFSTIIAIAFDGSRAYISNNDAGTISMCAYNSGNGTLSNCVTVLTGTTTNAWGLYAKFGYLYLSGYTASTVYVCKINADGTLASGTLGSCSNPGVVCTQPVGLDSYKHWLYVSCRSGGNVQRCTINPSTGALSGCTQVMGYGRNIALSISGTYLWNTIRNDDGTGTLIRMTLNPNDGTLSGSLIGAPTGVTNLNGPWGIGGAL